MPKSWGGVSDRSVSKWETGRCMPDLSLFEPLCAELGITVSELLNGEVLSRELFSGEKIKTEEKNTSDIIGYSQKQIENQKRKISYFIMAAGVLVSLSAFIVFSPESSWSSVYSIIGILIFTAGLFRELKIKNRIKKAGICALAFLVALTVFYAVDFFSVASFHRPPIYRYTTATEFGESKLITYDSLLYKVYRVNADTQNEYYIIDTRREYSSDTIPMTPFDREKSGLLPFDLHVHDLDVMVSVFGRPDSVDYTACRRKGSEICDQYRIRYGYRNGPRVSAEAAWLNACIPFTARWRVYFERGMVICDEKGLTGYGADGQTTRFDVEDPVKVPCGINLPPSGWFLRELTHFVQCAEQNAPSDRVKKQQVLDVLSVLETIQ